MPVQGALRAFGRRTWDVLTGGILGSKAARMNLEEFMKESDNKCPLQALSVLLRSGFHS